MKNIKNGAQMHLQLNFEKAWNPSHGFLKISAASRREWADFWGFNFVFYALKHPNDKNALFTIPSIFTLPWLVLSIIKYDGLFVI